MSELMGYLPESYLDSPETAVIQAAFQPEIQRVWEGRDGLLAQLDPNTATWGLRYWEEAFGLTVDESGALEQRRSLVIGKIRGSATTTPELLRSVAEGVLGVTVGVGEIFAENRVEIRFDAPNRLPAGLDTLKKLLDEIMPAHLAWDYLITLTPALYVGGHFSSYNVTTLPVLTEKEED